MTGLYEDAREQKDYGGRMGRNGDTRCVEPPASELSGLTTGGSSVFVLSTQACVLDRARTSEYSEITMAATTAMAVNAKIRQDLPSRGPDILEGFIDMEIV